MLLRQTRIIKGFTKQETAVWRKLCTNEDDEALAGLLLRRLRALLLVAVIVIGLDFVLVTWPLLLVARHGEK